MQPGDKVRLKANPGRIGILGNEMDGSASRRRVLVHFLDGDEQFVLGASLEKVDGEVQKPYSQIASGRYGRVQDLRGAVTYYRLSGKLANLIYSLNTTNTQFLAYQFKPVLHFLDSPCRGVLIADEVGLGKTIEAGLIWTELRAREDARRLLVVCPAMLREKWQWELADRFGVKADIVDADGLLMALQQARERPQEAGFALIASLQGLRPPRMWGDKNAPPQSASGRLARFLDEAELDDTLLDLVVIDEAHYLRNRETQTHRLGQLLRPVAENMVLLSATPIQLRSADLYYLLHLLDADAFPYEWSFEHTLNANAPILQLRDRVLSSTISKTEFVDALGRSLHTRLFDDNAQIEHLLRNPPTDEILSSPRGRSELAERLDQINPLAKVVTRTRKRDVQEMRVVREPVAIKSEMTEAEREFYKAVSARIAEYCQDEELSIGFMLTIPQRQMSSCMAAACNGWATKVGGTVDEEFDESVFEAFGDIDRLADPKAKLGRLLSELVAIARSVGDYRVLKDQDSKYSELIKQLRGYWETNPGKKVILFSFYRNTLHYLKHRLTEDGIRSVLVHGGIDKQQALNEFRDGNGPSILLSSEVAAEGVDLQFSSLLINYDLPWNPMRIEQRIGRIDRIGQEAEKILIWNFIYADTIDERIYDRLLERLNIFRYALGSIEAVLGEQIRILSYDLLSHALTPEQQIQQIDQARIAIETVNRNQQQLEEQATQLIAHGDYIQNKVRAARDLGRYIRGEDLLAYVRDFFNRHFEGSRLVPVGETLLEVKAELSIAARVAFADFLENHRLLGRTAVLSSPSPLLLFENRLGPKKPGIERVTQEHPLVRFVGDHLRTTGLGSGYSSIVAAEVPSHSLDRLSVGLYIYCVHRWTLSGSRDIERLEYVVKGLDNGILLAGENAERLVNLAAMEGKDWLGAKNVVDHARAAAVFEECKTFLDKAFVEFREAYEREDCDRINLMVNTLEHHRKTQQDKFQERIQRYRDSEDRRLLKVIPAEEGRLKKLLARLDERIHALRLREKLSASDSFVSGGTIRVI